VRALVSHGYTAHSVDTIAGALASIEMSPPDLLLLDLGLPDGDGVVVASHVVRHHPTLPVLILSARGEELDVVLGLEAGAIDYVVKPFRLAELFARIEAHLRLRDALNDSSGDRADAGRSAVGTGDVTVDRAARRVWVSGRDVALRPKEFDLLARLAREPGVVVTRERLIDDVWDEHWWGSTKTLDVHINSIRRKLGEQAGEPSRITTIRGVGYRFDPERTGS
jgi:DNA-binding response OmpR family regulator